MPSPLAITQLARMVGHEELLRRLGLPNGDPVPVRLTEAQRAAARALVEERAGVIARALVEEAAALDEIQSRDGALAYLRERLEVFAPLLTDPARRGICRSFKAATSGWTPARPVP